MAKSNENTVNSKGGGGKVKQETKAKLTGANAILLIAGDMR